MQNTKTVVSILRASLFSKREELQDMEIEERYKEDRDKIIEEIDYILGYFANFEMSEDQQQNDIFNEDIEEIINYANELITNLEKDLK